MFMLFEVIEGYLDPISIHPTLEEAMTSTPQNKKWGYQPSFMVHEWSFGKTQADGKWYGYGKSVEWIHLKKNS